MITYIFTKIQHCDKCHKRFGDYLLTDKKRKCTECYTEDISNKLIELVKKQLRFQ